MQRLHTRFPNRGYIVPSMLNILSFNELLDVRKEIPREYMKGTIEYYRSIINVSKFLVKNYAAKIDARSIQKIKDDIRQNEASLDSMKNRLKLKERVLGCTAKPKITRKDEATVIVKANGKAYRMILKSADICHVESVLKCDFCTPLMRKTNYMASFESQVKKGFMTRFTLKDYIVALVLVSAKISGARAESLSSVKIIEMEQGIVATVSTASGTSFKAIFKIVKDVYKMTSTIITKSSTMEITIKRLMK